MQIEKVAINKIKGNKANPRIIKDHKFHKLVKSLREFPEMLQLRPIVVDETMTILGGNMRYKACLEVGMDYIYILKATGLTDEKKNEFMLKDNVNFGEWDYGMLGNFFEVDQLIDFGINVLFFGDDTEDVSKEDKEMIIKDMELKFNEHHDYIVFLFHNSNDWIKAVSKLDLGKVPVSLSPKTKQIGLGRVVDSSKLIELLDKK